MAQHMAECALIGTWTLRGWFNRTGTGRAIYPLGEKATGLISYSPDGYVFVHLMAPGRLAYAVADPFLGTAKEDSAAMKSQITYAGSFEYHGDRVVHHVSLASCPNWVGTEQVRRVELSGDKLRLSAAGVRFQGEQVTAIVDWRRATPLDIVPAGAPGGG